MDATVQQAHKKQEASDVGTSANESVQAVAAGAESTVMDMQSKSSATEENNQVRTPTSDTAPNVENLEDGLVRLGITPSPSPPPAHHSSSGFPRSDYVPPLPGTGMDATNVFIKYLPTDLTNTGLYTLFSQFGEITSCKVMVDPLTGYSLGYGYVLHVFSSLLRFWTRSLTTQPFFPAPLFSEFFSLPGIFGLILPFSISPFVSLRILQFHYLNEP